ALAMSHAGSTILVLKRQTILVKLVGVPKWGLGGSEAGMQRDIGIAFISAVVSAVITLICTVLGILFQDRLRQLADVLSQRRMARRQALNQRRMVKHQNQARKEFEFVERCHNEPAFFQATLTKSVFEIIIVGGLGATAGIMASSIPSLPGLFNLPNSLDWVYNSAAAVAGCLLLISLGLLGATMNIAARNLRLYRNVTDFPKYKEQVDQILQLWPTRTASTNSDSSIRRHAP